MRSKIADRGGHLETILLKAGFQTERYCFSQHGG